VPADSARRAPAQGPPTQFMNENVLLDDGTMLGRPPANLNAEEELVLTEEDMIAHPPPGVEAPPPLQRAAAVAPPVPAPSANDEESVGDFEREGSQYSAAQARTPSVPGDARRVSIPIELGTLPRSGRVTLTVEISIQIDSDEARPKSSLAGKKATGLDDSFTRDLEPIP